MHLSPLWRFYLGPALTLPFLWAGALVARPANPHPIDFTGDLMHSRIRHRRLSALHRRNNGVLPDRYRAGNAVRQPERGRGIARFRIAVAACLVMLPIRAFVDPGLAPGAKPEYLSFSPNGSVKGEERGRILQTLNEMTGQHVVFVQYDRDRYHPGGWVYNDADIDGQNVVWAHDLGAAEQPRGSSILSQPAGVAGAA